MHLEFWEKKIHCIIVNFDFLDTCFYLLILLIKLLVNYLRWFNGMHPEDRNQCFVAEKYIFGVTYEMVFVNSSDIFRCPEKSPLYHGLVSFSNFISSCYLQSRTSGNQKTMLPNKKQHILSILSLICSEFLVIFWADI